MWTFGVGFRFLWQTFRQPCDLDIGPPENDIVATDRERELAIVITLVIRDGLACEVAVRAWSCSSCSSCSSAKFSCATGVNLGRFTRTLAYRLIGSSLAFGENIDGRSFARS
jgi:hypothetical protein